MQTVAKAIELVSGVMLISARVNKAINPRHRKFAHEYVRNGFNGVKAVYAAGYRQSYGSARVTATRLLTNANTVAMIENNIKRSKMSADEVLAELTEVAQTKTKIDGAQKVKALELLGKGHKLFTEKIETTDTTPDSLETAQQSFARQYQLAHRCTEAEAQAAAEAAFAFARVDDRTDGAVS